MVLYHLNMPFELYLNVFGPEHIAGFNLMSAVVGFW